MKHLLLTVAFLPLSILGIFAQNTFQRSVFFDKDKADIKSQGETTLVEVMDFLRKNPTFQIQLTGSTDADGNDEHNRVLSERRVQRIRQFLEKKGIPSQKIATQAFGEAKPIADNATEAGKKQNRRVDIQVRLAETPPSVIAAQKPVPSGKTDNIFKLYRELATSIQVFKIKTDKDTIIRGEKGTVLTIPKNAFSGVPNGAIVDVKLKEAYSFSDIIRDNLNTMSGDQPMQTGGMIYVEANANGQQLTLKRDLQVQFSSNESKLQGMELYTGQRDVQHKGAITWQSTGSINFGDNIMDRYIPEPMEPVTIFARDNGAFVPYYILNEKTRKPLSIKELCDTTGCFPLLLTTYQKDSFTVRPNMSNTCGALAMYVQARPKLKNKPITEIHRAAFNDAYLLYNVNEFDVLKKQDSRPWDSLMAERKNIAVYYESPAYLARKRAVDSIRAAYAERERIQDSILALKIEKNPAYRLNKLGWVNCDRLGYLGENQVATIKINLDKKDNYDLKVIVKKEKQVLTPSRTENGVAEFRVKKDENIVLVAMKIENGESFLSIMNVRGENTTLTPNLKALSVAEIKEKLKVLDN